MMFWSILLFASTMVSFAQGGSLQDCAGVGSMVIRRDTKYNITCPHKNETRTVSWKFISLTGRPTEYTIVDSCVLVSRSSKDYCPSEMPAFGIRRPNFAYTNLVINWNNVTEPLLYGVIECQLDGVENERCFLRLLPDEKEPPATPNPATSSKTSAIPQTPSPAAVVSPVTEEPTNPGPRRLSMESTSTAATAPATGQALTREQDSVSIAAVIGGLVAVITIFPVTLVGIVVCYQWRKKKRRSEGMSKGMLTSDDGSQTNSDTFRSYPSTSWRPSPSTNRRTSARRPRSLNPETFTNGSVPTSLDDRSVAYISTMAENYDVNAASHEASRSTVEYGREDSMSSTQSDPASALASRSNLTTPRFHVDYRSQSPCIVASHPSREDNADDVRSQLPYIKL